jgi:hypothetical protein
MEDGSPDGQQSEPAGSSFTKLTYVSDVSFGNFFKANAHSFVI